MTVQPINQWVSSYEAVFFKNLEMSSQPLLFRKWVHQNTKGLTLAVYKSKPTVTEAAFPPVSMPPATPIVAAQNIASAWFTYICSILWSTPAPIPPFSAISGVVWDMGLVSAAKESLIAALVLEFAKTPTPGPTGLKNKATGISKAFYQATMSLGVLVNGMSTSGPPVPLTVPDKIL
jgi:hypothetical protein